MKKMTLKQRMLGLIKGDEIDRVPFVQYHNMNASNEEIWQALGKDNMGVLEWMQVFRTETPNCRIEHENIREGELRGWRDTLITPKGKLTQRRFLVPDLNGPTGFAEHYIKTVKDYEILLAYLRDMVLVEDLSQLQRFHRETGDGGLPHISLPRTPYQALWIEWASIEDLVPHLQDAPELLNDVMQLLGALLIRALKITAAAAPKAEFYHVTMGDNIHGPLIGTRLFQKWCIPYYNEISDTLWEKGVPLFVHMDGDLKPLWGLIDLCRHRGFDSLSPPPDNDTRVGEALQRWPEKMVWANFPSSVHLQKPEQIYQQAMELLQEGGHSRRFWIQISEDAPPNVWKKSFPPILQAISDFGKP